MYIRLLHISTLAHTPGFQPHTSLHLKYSHLHTNSLHPVFFLFFADVILFSLPVAALVSTVGNAAPTAAPLAAHGLGLAGAAAVALALM
jgi:hypothetical protein